MSNDINLENEIESLIFQSPRGHAIRVLPAELESELSFAFRKLARKNLVIEANASAAFQPDEFRDRLRARVAAITHDCMRLFDRLMQGVATEGGSRGVGNSCLCLRGWIESEIKEAVVSKLEDLTRARQQPGRGQQGTDDGYTAGENTAGPRVRFDTTKQEGPKPRPGKERKGDASLLAGNRAVTFRTAEQYLGITERHRQNLMNDQLLTVVGEGHNRKITTESLRNRLPPEIPK